MNANASARIPLPRWRVAAFYSVYITWMLACCTAFIPLLLFMPRGVRHVGMPWARGSGFIAKHMLGIGAEVRGIENCQHGPVIYAAKHQSAWDIIMLIGFLRTPAFVLKRSLLFLPFFGLYLWRMQMVAINRKGGAQAMKRMIMDSKRALHQNRPIVIFPEGTRLPPGAIGAYHPGVAALYDALKVPVIPVALNSGYFWPKTFMTKYAGTPIIEYLPPIPPGLPPKVFLKELKARIEERSAVLAGEVR